MGIHDWMPTPFCFYPKHEHGCPHVGHCNCHDAGHYERFTKGLEDEVQRSGRIVLAYCWMSNHNLVRRVGRRHKQSASWRTTTKKLEATLGLNTEHKTRPWPALACH